MPKRSVSSPRSQKYVEEAYDALSEGSAAPWAVRIVGLVNDPEKPFARVGPCNVLHYRHCVCAGYRLSWRTKRPS